MKIPGSFFKTLTDAEWSKVRLTSALDAELCRRLWAMEGRTDNPPKCMILAVDRAEFERVFGIGKLNQH